MWCEFSDSNKQPIKLSCSGIDQVPSISKADFVRLAPGKSLLKQFQWKDYFKTPSEAQVGLRAFYHPELLMPTAEESDGTEKVSSNVLHITVSQNKLKVKH